MKVDIGISESNRQLISESLAKLLADTYILYLKTQNYHWNVTGHLFQSLHTLFETQYQDLAQAVDKIAERIRALGFPAPGSFNTFIKLATVKEAIGVPKAESMVTELMMDNEIVIKTARSAFAVASQADDQPTMDLLTERMEIHEKSAWMLRSIIS